MHGGHGKTKVLIATCLDTHEYSPACEQRQGLCKCLPGRATVGTFEGAHGPEVFQQLLRPTWINLRPTARYNHQHDIYQNCFHLRGIFDYNNDDEDDSGKPKENFDNHEYQDRKHSHIIAFIGKEADLGTPSFSFAQRTGAEMSLTLMARRG
ncbi:hypothetical protein TWF751_001166 [Orbilia oligospora]|nr:hypothetical protein TWF751_001166 [Orbilia oligospora]